MNRRILTPLFAIILEPRSHKVIADTGYEYEGRFLFYDKACHFKLSGPEPPSAGEEGVGSGRTGRPALPRMRA